MPVSTPSDAPEERPCGTRSDRLRISDDLVRRPWRQRVRWFALAPAFVAALACGGAPRLPTQRLCAPGQPSQAWIEARLAAMGPAGFADSLSLGAPTVFCRSDGAEVRGELVYVGLERLVMNGDRVQRREPLTERGRIPKVDPRFETWLVDLTDRADPMRISLGVRELR